MNQIREYLVNWGLGEGITWHSTRGKGNYIRKLHSANRSFCKVEEKGQCESSRTLQKHGHQDDHDSTGYKLAAPGLMLWLNRLIYLHKLAAPTSL